MQLNKIIEARLIRYLLVLIKLRWPSGIERLFLEL